MAKEKYDTVNFDYDTANNQMNGNGGDGDVLIPIGVFNRDQQYMPRNLGRYGVGETKYDEGIKERDIWANPDILADTRADRQGFGSELFNSLTQAGAEVVGGTLEGLGYISDPKTFSNFLDNTTFESGNVLSEWGRELKESSRENFPVFVDPDDGSFNPLSHEWWFSNLPSVASTLSLLIPSGAVVKGISALGKASKISQRLGLVSKAGDITKLGIASRGVGQAAVSRHMESMMEATQVGEERYKELIDQGLSEEEARKNSALAASITYKANWAAIVQDIPQYLLLNRYLAGKSAARSVQESRLLGLNPVKALTSKSYNLAKDMIGEGFEEMYQYMVGEEARYIAEKALHPEKNVPWQDRFGEYMRSGEMWTGFTMGMLGAGVMQTAGKKINDFIMKRRGLETPEERRIADIESWGIILNKASKDYTSAVKDFGPDSTQAEVIRQNIIAHLANKSKIQSGDLENFSTFIEELHKNPEESADRLGLDPDSVEMIKSQDPADTISDIKRVEEIFDQNYSLLEEGKLKNVAQVSFITTEQYLGEKLKTYKDQWDVKAQEHYTKSRFNDLSPQGQIISPQGQIILDNENQIDALNNLKKVIKHELKSAENQGSNKDTINSIKEFEIEIDNNIKQLQEETKKARKERSKEDTQKDKKFNELESEYQEYQKAKRMSISLQKQIERHNQMADEYRSKWDNFVSKQEKEKGKKDEELNKDTAFEPEKGNIVEFFDNQTREVVRGEVVSEMEDDPSSYNIKRLDNDEVVKLSRASFVILGDDTSQNFDQGERDILSEEETPEDPIENAEEIKDHVKDGTIKISYSTKKGKEIKVFDDAIDKYVSNPKNNLKNAQTYFYIDINELSSTLEQMRSELDTTGIKRLDKAIKEIAGIRKDSFKLSNQKITSLLNTKLSDSIHLYDVLPIGISVYDKGSKINSKPLYLYKSSNRTAQPEEKAFRKRVLTDLLKKKTVKLKGGLYKANSGFYNNTGKNRNVNEALDQDSKDIVLGIAKNDKIIYTEYDRSDYPDEFRGNPGNIFAFTNKSSDGSVVPIKLNPQKLSKEHADILWTALEQIFKKGGDGFAAKWPEGDTRVEGLTAFEVVKLLVNFGEENTSVDYNKRSYELGEHLRNKQLYYKKNILYFGGNSILFNTDNQIEHQEDKSLFISWATENKNYAAMLKSDSMGIELNGQFNRQFKLGSFTHDGRGKYSEFLINNGIVKSDVVSYQGMTTITRSPLLVISTKDSFYSSIEPKTKKESQTPTEKTTSTKEKKQTTKVRSGNNTLNTKSQLEDLQVGTKLYEEMGIPDPSDINKQQIVRTEIAEIVEQDGKKVILTKSDSIKEVDGMEISNPAVYSELVHAHGDKKNRTFLKLDVQYVSEEKPNLFDESGKLNEQAYESDTNTGKTQQDIREEREDPKDPGGFEGEDDFVTRTAKPSGTPYKIQDWENEVEGWLRSRLGDDVADKVVRKATSILRDGKEAWAQYTHDAILLFEGAETGTIYHEAFHRVSMGYLTFEQRQNVYREARKRYNLGPNVSSEEVEEFLAERFRDHVLNHQEARKIIELTSKYRNTQEAALAIYEANGGLMSLYDIKDRIKQARELTQGKTKGRLMRFIEDLFDFIYTLFTGKTRLTSYDAEYLFNKVDSKKFKHNKVLRRNIRNLDYGNLARMKVRGRTIDSVNSSDQLHSIVKGLSQILINTNNIDDINSIDNISWKPLITSIENKIKDFKETNNTDYAVLYDQILSDIKKDDSIIRELVDDHLLSIGIRRTNRNSELPQEDLEKTNEDEKSINYDTGIERYEKASYELDPKNNVLTSVKFMIATLYSSNERNKYSYMREFTDFNRTWNMLLHDLHNAEDINEMIEILEKKQESIYEYKHLLHKLRKGSELLKKQFEVAIKMHRHMFVDMSFRRRRIGNVVDYSVDISQSDLRDTISSLARSWNQLFIDSNLVSRPDYVINEDAFKKVYDNYKKFSNKVSGVKKKEGVIDQDNQFEFITEATQHLSKLGIEIPEEALYSYISGMKSDSFELNLRNFVSIDMNTLFSELMKKIRKGHISIEESFIDEKIIRNLAEAYTNVKPELLSNNVIGPDGALYWSYSLNSYVTDIIREINKDPEKRLNQIQSKLYSTRSYFADRLKESKNKLQLLTLGGIYSPGTAGKDYHNITSEDDYIAKLYFLNNNMLPFPTLADRKTYYLLKGIDKLNTSFDIDNNDNVNPSQDLVDLFYDYFLDERDRVETNKQIKENYLKEKDSNKKKELQKQLIANYHFNPKYNNGNIKDKDGFYLKDAVNQGNAYSYSHFSSFNNWSQERLEDVEQVKDNIRNILSNIINKELSFAESKGIISKNDKGEYRFEGRNNDLIKSYRNKFGNNHKGTIGMIADFAINTTMINIEVEKLFLGDPAFFQSTKKDKSTHVDRIKRSSVLTSTGTNLAEKVDGFTEFEQKKLYNSSVLKTQEFESYSVDRLREIHTELLTNRYVEEGMNRDDAMARASKEASNNLKAYTELDPTDAQVYITPEMHRSISIRLGEWSNTKQKAFDLLTSNKELTAEEEQEMIKVVLQPLKLVYFDLNQQGRYNVPIYDKMSLAPLYRRLFKSPTDDTRYDIEELIDRMEAKGKYEGLEPIHMMKFDTAVKSGASESQEYYGDINNKSDINDLSDITYISQSFKYLRRQLVTDPHEDSHTKVGTQLIKIALSNIIKDGSYKVDGRNIKGQDLIELVNDSLSALSSIGKRRVESKLGYNSISNRINWNKFSYILKDEARKAGMPDSILDGLAINENGELTIPLDSFADRKWIQSRIISLINKEVVDRIMPGGQLIQMSNFGIKKLGTKSDLNFVDINLEDNTFKAMEANVTIRLFKDLIPNYNDKTFEEKVKFLKDNNLDEIISYRIPTQGLSSIIALKVKNFLPETLGDTIMLPDEFTTLTGSDFDIDKLFVMRYNYYNKFDGSLKRTPFLENKNSTPEERYDKKIWEEFYINKQYFNQDLYNRVKRIKNERYKAYQENERDKISELNSEMNKIFENEIRSTLINERIILPFSEFKKLSLIEQNTEAAIQNKLISSYISVLSNPLHFIESTTPLGTLKDKLLSIRSEVLKNKGFEKISDLESLIPSFMNDIKFKYSGGKFGVAPFALSKAHHVLAQMFDLKLASKFELDPDIANYDTNIKSFDLSRIKGVDGLNISEWLSILIDAHVDIAKDSYIMDLNVNKATYDIVNFMIRSGFGETTFWFTSQPINVEKAEGQLGTDSQLMNVRFDPEDVISKYVKIGKFGKDENIAEIYQSSEYIKKALSVESLKENLKYGTKESKLDAREFALRQLSISYLNDLFNEFGNTLLEIVMSNRVDTKGYGNNIVDLDLFIDSIENIKNNQEISFEFRDAMYPDTIEPETIEEMSFIHNYTVNSIFLAKDIMSHMTIYSTEAFKGFKKVLLKNLGLADNTNNKLHNNLSDELFSGILGKFFADKGYESGDLVRMFNSAKENSTVDKYFKLIKKYPELKDNKFISYITPFRFKNQLLNSYIRIPVERITDVWTKNEMIRAFEDIYFNPNKEISNFAKELFVYSYYSSGFRKRLHSFFNLIPTSVIQDFGLSEYIRNQLKMFKENPERSYAEFEHVLEEVVKNNHDVPNFVPLLENEDGISRRVDRNGNTLYLTFNKSDLPIIGKTPQFANVYPEYFKDINGNLYRQIGVMLNRTDPKNPVNVYKAINKLGLTARRGMVLREYGMDMSIISENNLKSKMSDKAIIEEISDKFDGNFIARNKVEVDENIDPDNDIIDVEYEDVTEERKEQQQALPEGQVQAKEVAIPQNISTKETPLKIFVDGSDIKGTGQIGYGAVVRYGDTDYEISGIGSKEEFAKRYNLDESQIENAVSNPTMELLGTVETLKTFQNSSEHINILQDYEGAMKWLTDQWKAKKPWIKDLVEEGRGYIEKINNNGGSVVFTWIKGHSGNEYNDKADALAKSRDTKNTIKDLLGLNLGANSQNISNEQAEQRKNDCI